MTEFTNNSTIEKAKVALINYKKAEDSTAHYESKKAYHDALDNICKKQGITKLNAEIAIHNCWAGEVKSDEELITFCKSACGICSDYCTVCPFEKRCERYFKETDCYPFER